MSGLSQTVKDFTAGLCSGWAQVIIMQPFDIIKIRLQTQDLKNPRYHGILDCLKKIVAEEGPLALYKGTLSPLIGCGFQVSIQFGLNERVKRYFSKFKESPTAPLPMQYVGLSGVAAGFGCGLVSTPVQHARIRIQIQDKHNKTYSGSVSAAKHILSNYGITGLYLGFVPTILRECIGSGLYFFIYELIMRSFVKPGQRVADAPLSASLLAGGAAGAGYWAFTYPIDYLKTLIQTDDLKNRKYKGLLDCFNQRKHDGFKSFFRGYGVCMLRSVPVNGGGFFVFEMVMRALGRSAASE